MLWLLSFDDKNTLADAVDKYCIGVPPIQWLAWIPQLLTCLVGSEGKPLLNLISQVRPEQTKKTKSVVSFFNASICQTVSVKSSLCFKYVIYFFLLLFFMFLNFLSGCLTFRSIINASFACFHPFLGGHIWLAC